MDAMANFDQTQGEAGERARGINKAQEILINYQNLNHAWISMDDSSKW